MNDLFDDPAYKFKFDINYDSISQMVDSNKSIVFQSISLKNWAVIKTFNQQQVSNETTIYDNGISKQWVYKHDEELLIIEVFASTTDHKLAMEWLLNEATATTMRTIPFSLCPYRLGDLNVSILRDNFCRILWTYYNVFYSVKYTGNNLDIKMLCQEIQNDSNKLFVTDIEKYRPRFKEVIISSDHIKKGDTVSIKIIPSYGEAFIGQKKNSHVNISLEKIWSAEKLDLIDYTDFSFKFKGIAEGSETITFILADLDALTCAKHEVTITVSE